MHTHIHIHAEMDAQSYTQTETKTHAHRVRHNPNRHTRNTTIRHFPKAEKCVHVIPKLNIFSMFHAYMHAEHVTANKNKRTNVPNILIGALLKRAPIKIFAILLGEEDTEHRACCHLTQRCVPSYGSSETFFFLLYICGHSVLLLCSVNGTTVRSCD